MEKVMGFQKKGIAVRIRYAFAEKAGDNVENCDRMTRKVHRFVSLTRTATFEMSSLAVHMTLFAWTGGVHVGDTNCTNRCTIPQPFDGQEQESGKVEREKGA